MYHATPDSSNEALHEPVLASKKYPEQVRGMRSVRLPSGTESVSVEGREELVAQNRNGNAAISSPDTQMVPRQADIGSSSAVGEWRIGEAIVRYLSHPREAIVQTVVWVMSVRTRE